MRFKVVNYLWIVLVHIFIIVLAVLAFNEKNSIWLLVSEILVVFSLIFSFFLQSRINRPMDVMRRGLFLLREEDFTTTLSKVGYKEIDELIVIFNSMIRSLREKKLTVREQNQFLDLLIESSPMGLIIIDLDVKIRSLNPAAISILDIKEPILGKELSALPDFFFREIAGMQHGDKKTISKGSLRMLCSKSSFYDKGFRHSFFVLEELSAEMRKTEKETYRKLIRVMAHEVNNTTSSVNSILSEIRSRPDIFKDGEREETSEILRVAIDRSKLLNSFMQKFSDMVKLPEPVLKQYLLNESVSDVTNSYGWKIREKNIQLSLELASPSPIVEADRSQMEQVIGNIIKNAIESIENQGEIRVITRSNPVSLMIEDNGIGISEEVKEKLFTPFFTTKASGQGIGLTFAGEILSNHNFSYDLETVEGKTRFSIIFN